MSFLEAALRYREQGYSVIPITPRGKDPLVQWKENQTRRASEEEIRQWWGQYEEANVGIVMGHLSGLVAIDCDSEEATRRFVETYPEARDTLQVKTGKGIHFFFRWEPGVRNNAGSLLGPGIDTRGEGGFVVAPPSVHVNGNQYKWLNQNPTLPLPPTLREILINRPKSIRSSSSSGGPIESIDEGRRDTTLASLAGTMRRHDLANEAIAEGLRGVNERLCKPPLSETQIEKIAKSISGYEPSIASPIGTDVMDGSGIIWANHVPPPGEQVESLWGPFLYPSSIHLLAGDAGLGKTTLFYNVVVRLARGEPFAGFDSPRTLRILYYDLETPEDLFKYKLHLVSENCPPEGLAFARTSFSTDETISWVKKYHFDLIVIDTMNEAFQTEDENNNAEANRQMQELRRIVRETGAAILALSHMAQDATTKGVYKYRGATARPAAADVVLNLESAGLKPVKDDPEKTAEVVKLEVAKSRWAGSKEYIALQKVGEDRFELFEMSNGAAATQLIHAKELILESSPVEPETLETKEIIALGKQKGHSQPTMERALAKLFQTGQLKRPRKGAYCRPRIHPSPQGYGVDGIDGNGKGQNLAEIRAWRRMKLQGLNRIHEEERKTMKITICANCGITKAVDRNNNWCADCKRRESKSVWPTKKNYDDPHFKEQRRRRFAALRRADRVNWLVRPERKTA